MNRTDLADPTAGILATLDRHQPVAVFERGGGQGQVSFELEVETNGRRLDLDGGDLLGHWLVEAQLLHGRLRAADGSTTPIEAIGASSHGALTPAGSAQTPKPGDPALLRRSIVVCLEDGGLLAIFTASGNPQAPHSDEQREAALAGADGAVTEFSEVRLSTEYGPDHNQRRATLELWPSGDPANGPLRAAGSAIACAKVELPNATSTLAFFEWSVAGCPAVGRYEIIRAH